VVASNQHLYRKTFSSLLVVTANRTVNVLPECGTCQCPLTVKLILVECVDLKDVRNKHFVASSIKDLFDNIEAHKIIDFIKETRFISNFNVFILMFVICFFILA